jgi:hypothetical protein
VGGGAELLLKDMVAFRAGGGYDGGAHGPATSYVTGGLAAVSELGAIDASVRQDLGSASKMTTLLVGLRVFVQAPQPASGGPRPSSTTTDGSSGLPTTPSNWPGTSPQSNQSSPPPAPELH